MSEKWIQEMIGLGVNPKKYQGQLDEEEYRKELTAFLNSFEFQKLGQAIHLGQWEIALMNLSRMERKARLLGLEGFQKYFRQIRGALVSKEGESAKNVLALVIQRRIRLQKKLKGKQDTAI